MSLLRSWSLVGCRGYKYLAPTEPLVGSIESGSFVASRFQRSTTAPTFHYSFPFPGLLLLVHSMITQTALPSAHRFEPLLSGNPPELEHIGYAFQCSSSRRRG